MSFDSRPPVYPFQSGNDLRLKTIRLIGRQNLQLYKGWKGNGDAIAKEYERNKEVGLKFGTWKQGCLVYDDDGLVEQELLAMKGSATAEDGDDAVDDDIEMEEVGFVPWDMLVCTFIFIKCRTITTGSKSNTINDPHL